MAHDAPRPNIVRDNGCPFCLSNVSDLKDMKRYGDSVELPCACCGTYQITGSAIDALPHWNLPETHWAAIAYQVKKMTGRATPPLLDTPTLRALRETARHQLNEPDLRMYYLHPY